MNNGEARHEPTGKLQLLACDIDGTLMGDDGDIPTANVRALSRIRDNGIATVLSSGRALVSVRGVADRMYAPRETDFYIAFNGAQIAGGSVRAGSKPAMIVDARIDPELVAALASYARRHGLVVQAYDGEKFLAEMDSEVSRRYAVDTGMTFRIVRDLAASTPGGTPKLLVIADHETLQRHKAAIDRLGGSPDTALDGLNTDAAPGSGDSRNADSRTSEEPPSAGFVSTFSKPHYLELIPPGVSKGAALARLCGHLGIPLENAAAIGDGQNDVEMIQEAGIGVAVANAAPAVRAVADVVTRASAWEGAVAEAVERLF